MGTGALGASAPPRSALPAGAGTRPGAERSLAGGGRLQGVGSDELPAAGQLKPEAPRGLGAGQDGAQPFLNSGPSLGSLI